MLRSEQPLSVVMPTFLEWLARNLAHITETTKTPYHPGILNSFVQARTDAILFILVLVAHNGFSFDFPILLAEVERRVELNVANFVSSNVHFSDTLHMLKKVLHNNNTSCFIVLHTI